MARGVAKSPEERIQDIQAKKEQYQQKIDSYQAKISDLDKQIKAVKKEEESKKLDELLGVIEASGKSVDEVLASLKNGTEN